MKEKLKWIVPFAIILLVGGILWFAITKVKDSVDRELPSAAESSTQASKEQTTTNNSQDTTTGSSDTSAENTSDTSASETDTSSETTGEATPVPNPLGGKMYASGTIEGDGREGTKGTGKFNYGEALQKSLVFYELQRSGALPDVTRCNWRGDSALTDGSDVGVDLTGGWFDAGDNVKFNLPMAYSAAVLGWSVYEDKDAYVESNQLDYALGNIRWANEYFIRCHPSDEVFYYQVGNGSQDHTWWGPAECVSYQMSRPSYCVTADKPGSAVTGEAAASLAVSSLVFKEVDPAFSKLCLEHAISLYAFADKYKSDAGYTAAEGFYNSWSGFYDELSWAGVWLYRATGDNSYLDKAKEYYSKAGQDYKWSLCWDDVHIGAAVLLAQETGESTYSSAVEKNLDFWTTGTSDGERITYTPKGLAWLDSWGSLRYATTTAFVATVYSEWEGCPSEKKDTYWNFAVSQADYALGSTGFSYMIGFGDSYPVHPHHRTAQGSYADNMNTPSESRHILCGALVGGPDASDGYTDEVSNYNTNEVACDYNAGFTGLLAKLYTRYHGETLTGFGCCEIPSEEYKVDATQNASGSDFLEIKAVAYNMTAWPARAPEKLELRYYFDVSSVFASGGKISDLKLSTNYIQDAEAKGIFEAPGAADTAYVSIVFAPNACYPGGQEEYKKEVQFRITGIDPSVQATASACLYENDMLVYGEEPTGSSSVTPTPATTAAPTPTTAPAPTGPVDTLPSGPTDPSVPSDPSTPSEPSKPSDPTKPTDPTKPGDPSALKLTIEYAQSGSANAISGNMTIENTSDKAIDLSDAEILYYFTNEKALELEFSCYHAAVSRKDGKYDAINTVTGAFGKVEPAKKGADMVCTMASFGKISLGKGDKLIVQFSINHKDWSDFNLSDDYSREKEENIVIRSKGQVLFGKEP
ncbi:MAG: glycoside hydrolase family 9 protein [Clostridiales bacterium]|nr:glycoside hydrolase family 9 protein [Clostridiales bacterium]